MATSSTTRGQRIGIWAIAGLMVLGTIGSLLAVLLANDNAGKDQERLQQLYSELNEKVVAHNAKLSKKYFDDLAQYRGNVSAFDEVTELEKEDIVIGSGEEIGEDTTYWAYYIGWLADGTVFDSSFDGSAADFMKATSLKGPFEVEPGSTIEGWQKGVLGMKVGGVRELTIPANLGYGEGGSGEIPANASLRFVVFTIDNPDQPEISNELIKLQERAGDLQ